MHLLCHLGKWITTERLNILLAVLTLLLAALTLFLAWVAYKLSERTLSYMKDRDFELDTRNGWVEIHKAMVALRTHGALAVFPGPTGEYGLPGTNAADLVANYTLARTQLLGQLDRLNDDPLLVQISEFLNANLLSKDWQTERFENQFDEFVHQVALKARPK
jgi:hypothetical protein